LKILHVHSTRTSLTDVRVVRVYLCISDKL